MPTITRHQGKLAYHPDTLRNIATYLQQNDWISDEYRWLNTDNTIKTNGSVINWETGELTIPLDYYTNFAETETYLLRNAERGITVATDTELYRFLNTPNTTWGLPLERWTQIRDNQLPHEHGEYHQWTTKAVKSFRDAYRPDHAGEFLPPGFDSQVFTTFESHPPYQRI